MIRWQLNKYKTTNLLNKRIVLRRQSSDTKSKYNINPVISNEIWILFLSDEEPTLKTLDFSIRIGSTPTFYISIYEY